MTYKGNCFLTDNQKDCLICLGMHAIAVSALLIHSEKVTQDYDQKEIPHLFLFPIWQDLPTLSYNSVLLGLQD